MGWEDSLRVIITDACGYGYGYGKMYLWYTREVQYPMLDALAGQTTAPQPFHQVLQTRIRGLPRVALHCPSW